MSPPSESGLSDCHLSSLPQSVQRLVWPFVCPEADDPIDGTRPIAKSEARPLFARLVDLVGTPPADLPITLQVGEALTRCLAAGFPPPVPILIQKLVRRGAWLSRPIN